MKTYPFSRRLAVCSVLLAAASLWLPLHGEDENKNTNRDHLKGYREREANTITGLNQAMSDLQTNPDGLFDRLDRDGNGTLTKEEFSRMVNLSSQGAAGTEGTRGIKGASSATGSTGGTSVSGQATLPSQPPATYGQQPGTTGQQPAAGQQPANPAAEAAAAGQQPVPTAAPGTAQPPAAAVSPGSNPQPAPGQNPSPSGTSTAPVAKDPQAPKPQP